MEGASKDKGECGWYKTLRLCYTGILSSAEVKGIPDFWLTALKNTDLFTDMIKVGRLHVSPNVNTHTFTPHTCIFALTHTLTHSHPHTHPHISPNVNTHTFTPHKCICTFSSSHTLTPSHSSSPSHTHPSSGAR